MFDAHRERPLFSASWPGMPPPRKLLLCANYNNFSAITGIQRDRLVCYVKENYKDSTEKIIKSARLYFKLDENEKNDLTQEIMDALSKLEDEHLLMLECEIVKCGMQVKGIITDRLKAALEKGKIKQFLSLMLLETLLYSIKKEDSMELKKNMLLQCLYSSGRNSRLFLKRKKKESWAESCIYTGEPWG